MERDLRPSSHQLHFGSGFVQQGGKVQGRCACTEHHYLLPAEAAQFVMFRTMCNKLPRQLGEGRRNVSKGGNAGGRHDATHPNRLPVRRFQLKAGIDAIHAGDFSLFQSGHKPALKLLAVGDEGFKWNRQTDG